MTASTDSALAQARLLLEPDAPASAAAPGSSALAWALKDLCYESWNNDPPRAVRAADALRAMSDAGVPADQAHEVKALAEWTAGIASVTRGQMNDAVQRFDAAAAALREIGLDDPAAQTQVPKIMALSMLGQHDLAAECGERAQRVLLALGNLKIAARVSQNLGGLQLHRDAYPQAARHYREASALFARLGDHEHAVSADIGLADTLTAMGDFEEAHRTYTQARLHAHRQGLDLQVALVDESMALVGLARGRYHEALGGFEAARRKYHGLGLPHCVAIVEKQLADTYLDLRLLPEALALFDQAVTQFAVLEMPDERAWALAQRGRTEALLGKTNADASLAAAAEVFAAHGNAVGAAAIALARAELALGNDALDDALAWADEAAQVFSAAGHSDGSSRANVIRAQALLLDGRWAEARTAFEATLQHATALQQTHVRVRCHTGLGQAALSAGEPAQACAAFDAAIALFEEQRRALPGDDMRMAFLTDHLRPYREKLRMALASGSAQATLVQLERFRGRALDERLVETNPPEVEDELRPLRERLNWLTLRLQRLEQEAGRSKPLMDELQRTEGELLERSRRGRMAATDLVQGEGAAAGLLNVPDLQAALHPGDALVEYGVLDNELFACVVTRDSVTLLRDMANWNDVVEEIEATRFQLETMRHGAGRVAQHLQTLTRRMHMRLARLHALVWTPLAECVAACQRVLLVPHGQLGTLPFAALAADGAVPLGQSFELAVAPSARAALRGLTQRPVAARGAIALGETSRLPHTGREAEFVASLFDPGCAFVAEQATVDNLREHAPAADVIHLACHAQFRSDNPRFSALHLHDGPLSADVIETLRLKPCTVVLSGCETGLAEQGAGDEMVGLVRAFLVAGAARVVASLWTVDDQLTAQFMANFYGGLARGQGAAAALRIAQTVAMQQDPHPFGWAAFTLYGGW